MTRWLLVPKRRILACAVMLALGLPVARADAQSSATRTFEGWTATCNNLKSCVVIATAQDDLFYVRIARPAGAMAVPAVKIVLAAQEPQKGGAPAFRLTTVTGPDRTALGPLPATAANDDPSVLAAAIAPGEPSLAFIEAVRNAASLEYAVLGTRGTLDLEGLVAALRFVDDMQGRVGTPTALVARGNKPAALVPAPPSPPIVTAAPAGSVGAVEKPVVAKATSDLAAGVCDPDVVKDQSEVMAWRMASDRILVAIPCTQGAYNLTSALYFTNAAGTEPKAVSLARAGDEAGTAPNVVVNADFDPKTMELKALDKGRGLGDCGTATTWLWTGQAFVLLDVAALDACPGALSEDWPSLYVARKH